MTGRTILKGPFGFIGSAFYRILIRHGVPFEVLTSDNWHTFAADQVDLFIDCAGNSKKYLADQDSDFDRRKNVDEVRENLDQFRPARYLHISSSAVYADVSNARATREVVAPPGVASTYGMHKRQAEHLVRQGPQRFLILRPAGFFGPGISKGPVYDLLENRQPRISPDSSMQLLDADFFASAAIQLANGGGTFNAVPGEPTILRNAMPELCENQQRQWPTEQLPRLGFAIDGARFLSAVGPIADVAESLRGFTEMYQRRELRSAVNVLVLAGGLGTRLGGVLPKPAMSLGEAPLVCHVINPFHNAGYTRIVVLLGHGASQVTEALRADDHLKDVSTFVEPQRLGTGGAVLAALSQLDCETAVIVNGDTVYRSLDVERLVKRHVRTGAEVTLLAQSVPDAAAFGTLEMDLHGRLIAFRDKAHQSAAVVYAGTCVVNRARFLQRAGPKRFCSLEDDLFPLFARARTSHVLAERELGFVDAGTPEGFRQAQRLVAD